MVIAFPPPLADAADFPAAQIRVNPGIGTSIGRIPILRDVQRALFDHVLFTKSGRAALGLVARELGFAAGDRILLPAYHCPAMVEPFIWSGAQIDFYHVTPELNVDLDDLEKKLRKAKACVLVRYFGFPQNVPDAAQLSDESHSIVIEDCAHSFFSLDSIRGLEPISDVAVFSLNKFFPTIDGGAIRFIRREFNPRMRAQSNLSETKALFRSLGITNPLSWLTWLVADRTARRSDEAAAETDSLGTFRYFDPDELNIECFRHTEWIVRHGDFDRIGAERRANFRFLLEHLSDSRTGTPLFKMLPDAVVPYVYPFLLRDENDFNVIRQNGLEVLRWEEFAISDCPISESYRARLIQLPCHQGLSKSALNRIVDIIASIRK